MKQNAKTEEKEVIVEKLTPGKLAAWALILKVVTTLAMVWAMEQSHAVIAVVLALDSLTLSYASVKFLELHIKLPVKRRER